MNAKEKIIKLAHDELGYLEKSRDDYELYGSDCLYFKTRYAGADNYTKYAYELRQAGCGHPNGYAWCETFIAFLFFKVLGKEMANKLLCGMLSSASTMDVKNAFIKAGRQVPLNKAEPGDIVFRSRSGGGHVGLVVGRSSSGQIITIEGNTSANDASSWNGGAVAQHIGAKWEWCVRPDWSLVEPETWRWICVAGTWYYQNNRGENKHGWALIKETDGQYSHWYWFNSSGAMQTGLAWIDDELCVFMTHGALEGALCHSNDNDKGYQHVWNVE